MANFLRFPSQQVRPETHATQTASHFQQHTTFCDPSPRVRCLTVPNTPAFDSPPGTFLSPAPPAAAVAEPATVAQAAAAAPADPRVVKNSRRVTPPAPGKISLSSDCSSSWGPLVHWCCCWRPLGRDRTELYARGCLLLLLLLMVVVGILGDGLVGRLNDLATTVDQGRNESERRGRSTSAWFGRFMPKDAHAICVSRKAVETCSAWGLHVVYRVCSCARGIRVGSCR